MADAPAIPSSPPAPAAAGHGDPSLPSVSVPRVLPSTMLLDTLPPCSGRARGPRGGGRAVAAASGSGGGRGRTSAVPAATSNRRGGTRPPDRLVEAIGKMPTRVGAGLASAGDILQLANAKGPMFEWLSYWPEEGFPDQDHPY